MNAGQIHVVREEIYTATRSVSRISLCMINARTVEELLGNGTLMTLTKVLICRWKVYSADRTNN